MDTEKFIKYYENDNIIKLGGWQGGYYLNIENNIIISFFFFHQGFKSEFAEFDKRIIFKLFNPKDYKGEIPLKNITTETYFLVNSDHPDYSILFKLSINSKKRIVKLELLEYPTLGLSLLSNEEKNSIIIEY